MTATYPTPTSTTRTMTTHIDYERGYIVLCTYPYGTDTGTRWEVAYSVLDQDVASDGRLQNPELHYYGRKLTRKGTPLTGHPHLLYWIHSDADMVDAHDAATAGASR